MIPRPEYLEKIRPFINVKIVKILVGIRRCGKSTILEMIKQELLSQGIHPDHIVERRYDRENYDAQPLDASLMYKELRLQMPENGKYYFLIDEPQEINGWEKAVNTLLEDGNADIYITGSNSKLLSSEISTYLTGRYVKIPVYTLSFKEYLTFKEGSGKPKSDLLRDYMRLGGFPLVATANFGEEQAYAIVKDIYNSVVLSDIVNRHKIADSELFGRVVRFVIDNIGKTFSANSIVAFLKSEHRKLSIESIYNYLEWLEKAFVVSRCSRFDLQGKSILKTQEKFYLADSSIKYALFGFNPSSIAAMMENIVFLELKRRGFDVYVGKYRDKEIDFVAVKRDERLYIQVCRSMPTESNREIANLLMLRDNYPKMIVTLDEYAAGNINGIKVVHLSDFLLNE